MMGGIEDNPTLWVEPRDKLGRPIDAEILSVARRSWKRVLIFARQHGVDEAIAAGVLETAVQGLSSVLSRRPQSREQIKNLDDYFFWVVAHRLYRRTAKEPPIEYVGSVDELDLIRPSNNSDWVARFENQLLLNELSTRFNVQERSICDLRAIGRSWKEVGRTLGIKPNTAQVQFLRAIERARKSLMRGLRLTPKQGRPK